MKLPHFTALTALLGGLAYAEPMQDRVTAEEMNARRASSGSLASPAEDPRSANAVRPSGESIIASSVIISDGTNWTLVPRGAVIYLPEKHHSKVGVRPVGNLLSWREFSAINRAWIGAEKVTLRQAEGIHPFDERRIAFWPKQERVVVATYLDGPISVASPEPDQETAANR